MNNQTILSSKDGKRKFEVRVNKETKNREILYVGDTLWQECEEGKE